MGESCLDIVDERTIDCALQHIKTFREQALREEIADFGEPCQNCIHRKSCKFDWFSILSPLRCRSSVKINTAVPEQSPQQDNNQSVTVDDKDTLEDTDTKSL